MVNKKQYWVIMPILLLMIAFPGMVLSSPAPAPGAVRYPWRDKLMLLLNEAVREKLPKIHELKLHDVRSLSTVAARIPAAVHHPSFSVREMGNWNRQQGNIPVQIMISLPSGKSSSCWLRVFISGKTEVLVAKHALARGSAVQWRDVTTHLVDSHEVNDDCLIDFPLGAIFEVVRKIAAGQPLTSGSLRPYRLVKRGEMVTVVLERDGIRIVTKGKAMGNGSRNEVIMIKNPTSRRLYQAQVIAAGQVRVVY